MLAWFIASAFWVPSVCIYVTSRPPFWRVSSLCSPSPSHIIPAAAMVAHNSENILFDISSSPPFFHTYVIFDLLAIVVSMLVHVMLLYSTPESRENSCTWLTFPFCVKLSPLVWISIFPSVSTRGYHSHFTSCTYFPFHFWLAHNVDNHLTMAVD